MKMFTDESDAVLLADSILSLLASSIDREVDYILPYDEDTQELARTYRQWLQDYPDLQSADNNDTDRQIRKWETMISKAELASDKTIDLVVDYLQTMDDDCLEINQAFCLYLEEQK